jgi:16S rRNA (adenine1518-N6/adenine1519-N6)-dimethyltransferase
MQHVRPKKHLGQHFLKDLQIAERIAAIADGITADKVIEIGPGMGVLTKFLFEPWGAKLLVCEIDTESVAYLKKASWAQDLEIIEGDFLVLKPEIAFPYENQAILGNYPYNISTEIAFKVIENREKVGFFGGMFQLEVAKRFCAKHGNKEYGITSVLLQAYYDCAYLFDVEPEAFNPPPKVRSGVMACTRKAEMPACSHKSLSLVTKTAFSQRRKTLSNALKPLLSSRPAFQLPGDWAGKRAEQLSVENFVFLAQLWEQSA